MYHKLTRRPCDSLRFPHRYQVSPWCREVSAFPSAGTSDEQVAEAPEAPLEEEDPNEEAARAMHS